MSNITDTKVIMYNSEEAAKHKEIELKGGTIIGYRQIFGN